MEKASFYNAVNVFYLKETARWAYIVKNAGANDIAVIIDQAMADIEESNPALKGSLSLNLYATLGAPKEKIKQLIDEKNKIDESRFQEEDLIGRVYEYFLQVYNDSSESFLISWNIAINNTYVYLRFRWYYIMNKVQ